MVKETVIDISLGLHLLISLPTDAEFIRAQEDWIQPAYCQLVYDLGSPHFKVRQSAYVELIRQGKKSYRALLGGLKSKDPEIRYRCSQIVDEIFNCPLCHGATTIKDDKGRNYYCPACEGWGFLKH